MRLHNKGVRSHVSAVATADADGFIHPDSLIAHVSPEEGFPPGGLHLRPSGGGKGVRRRISQDSGVPAGHHEFDRTILGLGLLGDLKSFLGGGSQNRVQGVALSELCLLYTSPSPRDATLSRMPSSA